MDLSHIAQDPLLQVGGYVLAVASVIISIVVYKLQVKERVPLWKSETISLIEDYTSQVAGLQISYAGEAIKTLTRTNIYFWNAGKQSIRREDIASGDTLRIVAAEGVKILSAEMPVKTNSVNSPMSVLCGKGKHIDLSFEFLDGGDGFMMQCLHTGKDENALKVTGFIIEGGKPQQHPRFGRYNIARLMYAPELGISRSRLLATFLIGLYALGFGSAWLIVSYGAKPTPITLTVSVFSAALTYVSLIAATYTADVPRSLRKLAAQVESK